MKTTLDLPDELVREAKLRAVMQGRTLRDLVADFIRQGLSTGAAPKSGPVLPSGSAVTIGAAGLPIIQCRADAQASRMSPEDLIELEQQAQAAEDIRHARRPV